MDEEKQRAGEGFEEEKAVPWQGKDGEAAMKDRERAAVTLE